MKFIRDTNNLPTFQGIHVHVGNIDDGAEATVAVRRETPLQPYSADQATREFSIKRFGTQMN